MGRGAVRGGSGVAPTCVEVWPAGDGVREMHIHTARGVVRAYLHEAPSADAAVLMVGGAGGDVTGPAGVYPDLAEDVRRQGIAALRLRYRSPANLEPCVLDTLAGIEALSERGHERVVLLGWSFGGAVAIAAGARDDRAAGVATVASQSHGTGAAAALAPRALLLLHGTGDRTLPPACSLDIYERAAEPKEIEIYPGANHGLDQVREDMRKRLAEWFVRILAGATK